jgi:hypothetical protein
VNNRQSGRFRISETPERSDHSVATPQNGGRGGSTAAVLWIGSPTFGFAALGAGLMFIADDATVGSRIYTSTPQFKVWAALMIGLVASLPVVWRVGLDLLRRLGLNPLSALRSKALPVLAGVILVVAAAVLAGVYARGGGSSLYGDRVRIAVIYILGVTATVPAFLAMWECYRQLAGNHGIDEKHSDAEITRLLLLRECLMSSLTTVGLLVSAGVLATGAERQAALAAPKYAAPYPSAYVLIWGIAFSALLLINFTPAFRRLTNRANIIIDSVLPILLPGSDRWQDRLQERQDLANLLRVTGSAKDVITSAVLVAGPLISSAFSLFLPGSSG